MMMVDSTSKAGGLSDGEILSEVAGGDVEAYGKLVHRYRGRLYNFVFRFVGDPETAEDVVQETFLRAFRKRTGGSAGACSRSIATRKPTPDWICPTSPSGRTR